MSDDDETCMMHVPSGSMEERPVAHAKWGAPLVGIHSVGDTHFGDTHFGDTRSVPLPVALESIASASSHRVLEPVRMTPRRLNLPRDPDATPLHAPDAALLQALQPQGASESASHSSLDSSAAAAILQPPRVPVGSPLGTLRPLLSGLCGRVRRLPSPVLGVLLGGVIGLISALSIHVLNRRAQPSPARVPQVAVESRAVESRAVESRAAEPRPLQPGATLRGSKRKEPADEEEKVKLPSAPHAEESPTVLAQRALSHHFEGRCAEAVVGYRQLEQMSSQQNEKTMWREFRRACERACVAPAPGEKP